LRQEEVKRVWGPGTINMPSRRVVERALARVHIGEALQRRYAKESKLARRERGEEDAKENKLGVSKEMGRRRVLCGGKRCARQHTKNNQLNPSAAGVWRSVALAVVCLHAKG
jgi:hypothetical protein